MNIDDLMPNKSGFSVSNDMLYYDLHGMRVPVAYVTLDDYAYIFLDAKIVRQVEKVVKLAMDRGYRFYMAYPDDADPAGVSNWKEKVVKHYLLSHIKEHWRKSFIRIGFDLIKNMCDWAAENDCQEVLKEVYDGMEKEVNYSYTDWYAKKREVYTYSEEIREEWKGLWREIQINTIL